MVEVEVVMFIEYETPTPVGKHFGRYSLGSCCIIHYEGATVVVVDVVVGVVELQHAFF